MRYLSLIGILLPLASQASHILYDPTLPTADYTGPSLYTPSGVSTAGVGGFSLGVSGNPGAFRRIRYSGTTTTEAALGEFSAVFTWDPSTQGEISAFGFRIDAQQNSNNNSPNPPRLAFHFAVWSLLAVSAITLVTRNWARRNCRISTGI